MSDADDSTSSMYILSHADTVTQPVESPNICVCARLEHGEPERDSDDGREVGRVEAQSWRASNLELPLAAISSPNQAHESVGKAWLTFLSSS